MHHPACTDLPAGYDTGFVLERHFDDLRAPRRKGLCSPSTTGLTPKPHPYKAALLSCRAIISPRPFPSECSLFLPGPITISLPKQALDAPDQGLTRLRQSPQKNFSFQKKIFLTCQKNIARSHPVRKTFQEHSPLWPENKTRQQGFGSLSQSSVLSAIRRSLPCTCVCTDLLLYRLCPGR